MQALFAREREGVRCPGCHGPLRILAFLTEPDVVEGILRHLGLPHRPPKPTRTVEHRVLQYFRRSPSSYSLDSILTRPIDLFAGGAGTARLAV